MSLTSTPASYALPSLRRFERTPRVQHFPRHAIEPPVLTLNRTYYPMGFPVEVRTNEAEIFSLLSHMWGRFEPFCPVQRTPLRFDVHVVEGEGGAECPPAPVHRLIRPLLMAVADGDNYSTVDLTTLRSQACLSRSTLRYPLYAEWFLLSAPLSCISTRLATPVHGACISRAGYGVLLCGESGAGKSTLAYACARAGWTFTSDDATFIPHPENGRRVIGNCHQVRLRPSAVELFPEIAGREVTPRAAGKPSIEIATDELPGVCTTFSTVVRRIVFLDRRPGVKPLIDSLPTPVARRFFRGVLFGLPETLAVQYEVLEHLLKVPVHRLRYERLEDAIALLGQLTDRSHG